MRKVIAAVGIAITLGAGILACGRTDDTCTGLNDCVEPDGATTGSDGGQALDSSAAEGSAAMQGTDAADGAPLDGTVIGTVDGAKDAGESLDSTLASDAEYDAQVDASQPDTSPECTGPEKLCGAGCVSTSSPNTGCGGPSCTACDLANATADCAVDGGTCAISACNPGFADCDLDPTNGCETNTTTTTNCGTCGTMCSGATPYCVAGTGGVYACGSNCPAGQTLCSGSCADLTSNAEHCGTCATVCTGAGANAMNECVSSACTVVCDPSYTSCGGACVDYANNNGNCGSCGYACPAVANGSDTCQSSVCTVACNPGYPDLCTTTNVCVNWTNDGNNCGKCGNVCPTAPTNGTDNCVSSTCTVACDPSYPNLCSDTNTCVNWSNDNDNCGQCGNKCSPLANGTDNCVSSTCDPVCNSGYQLCGGTCYPLNAATTIFVSTTSTLTTGCGAIDAPCATIASGLTEASAQGKTLLYLDQGTYAEQVTLVSGISLEGGWVYSGGGNWTKQCSGNTATAVIKVTADAEAVIANGVTATLTNVSIVNATAALTGESLYGIFSTSSTLTLNNVDVTVADGGTGAQGAAGGIVSGTTSCASAGDSKPGVTGSVGGAGSNGTYGSGGFTPVTAPNGGTGLPGDCGGAGQPGTAGTCTKSNAPTCCDPPECGTPVCDCGGIAQEATAAGAAGTPGVGGVGGALGDGGTGGGASIGLFVYGGTVQITSGTVTAGTGGQGGSGGNGGGGASGASGSPGSGTDCEYCTSQGSTFPACTLEGCTKQDIQGTGGPAGGNGGSGGAGGGGAGGDSYAYYTANSAVVTASETTLTAATTPAPGGTGGSAGLPGRIGQHN